MSTPDAGSQNPYAPPTALVQDIVDPDGRGQVASRGSRLGAISLDSLVGVIVCMPVLVTMISGITSGGATSALQMFSGGGAGLTGVLVLAWIVLTIILVARNGQTLGKRLVGIKVVRTDGSKASLGRIFWLRNVVNGIPGMIAGAITGSGMTGIVVVVASLLGNLYALADYLLIFGEERRCLHDRIADTMVVEA